MKVIHQFFWLIFVVSFGILLAQHVYISSRADGFNILELELASRTTGASLLTKWNNTMVDTSNMLYYARLNTLIDFLFIMGYTSVLIIVSNYLMQREKSNLVNELLRACFPAAILVALLDIAEDFILLFNMYHYQAGNKYISAAPVSYPKWVLVGLILMFWIISLVRKPIARKVAA